MDGLDALYLEGGIGESVSLPVESIQAILVAMNPMPIFTQPGDLDGVSLTALGAYGFGVAAEG